MWFSRFRIYLSNAKRRFLVKITYLLEFRFLKKKWQRDLLTFVHVLGFSYLAFKFCERLYNDNDFFLLTAWAGVILPSLVFFCKLLSKFWRWMTGR